MIQNIGWTKLYSNLFSFLFYHFVKININKTSNTIWLVYINLKINYIGDNNNKI
jgi:hypothetical protein